ncbi:MAG: signal recognition particle-docking protein FtsY [Gemmatimonadetes bacterium]|nr:signal recognition particle-docking protein FtsY [Gemmatimonadota bacterium]NNM04532.1 signal recognition particle-docking protein FtsY [Gemmatimonadota bacterium]
MARLFRTRSEKKTSLWGRVVKLALTDVRVAVGGMDTDTLETLEERLLGADFGVPATLRLVDKVEELARKGKVRGRDGLRGALQEEMAAILAPASEAFLGAADSGPTVYLICGVNGVGKTTSIAKLAHRLLQEGQSVMVAAADTFRAGAVEQLSVWAERVGADFIGGQKGGDPAAVAFDAIEAAETRETDVVLVDTAGRLHTHKNLMEELQKVDRVVQKKLPGAPHETLIVLDATIGQNARAQVEAFSRFVSLSGIILAKLDSTARGGIVVNLLEEFGLPVKLVGTGEGLEDLEVFDPEAFVEGVFQDS